MAATFAASGLGINEDSLATAESHSAIEITLSVDDLTVAAVRIDGIIVSANANSVFHCVSVKKEASGPGGRGTSNGVYEDSTRSVMMMTSLTQN